MAGSSEPVLVWGAGAIGGAVGAFLARAGHRVTVVDRMAAHVAAIRDPAQGLRISGPVAEFALPLPAFQPEELDGRWATILLAVKAQDTAVAAEALRPHLAEGGVVICLQNGLCAWTAAETLGRERVVAASINFAGDWLSPGYVRFGARGALALGELDGGLTPRLNRLAVLLRDFEPEAAASPDVRSAIWSKLCFATLLTAHATGQGSIVECLARSELLPLWRRLGGEMAAIAASTGVTLHRFDAFDPADFTEAVPEPRTRVALAGLIDFTRRGAKTHSGIWRDLAVHRRRTEVSSQMGPVLEAARRGGISCGTLTRLVRMVEEIETGRRRQDDANPTELMQSMDAR